MIDCAIRLDVRDSQPLARAFTLARGDENAVRLLLRFFDGEEELGQQTGDYATLSLRKFGEETSTDYLLTRADGAYALTVTAAMAASEGVYLATAVLYDQEDMRLTVGRFCFAVRDDLNLPADGALSQQQVTLLQQALGAIALLHDEAEALAAEGEALADYAQEQGDYAKLWGDAAKGIVEGAGTTTWETLAGKPSAFPPAAHSHSALDSAASAATASTLVKRDALGRFQAAAPAAEADVARKAEVDAVAQAKADAAAVFTVSLPVSGWTGSAGAYAQTVQSASAQGDRVPIASPVLPEEGDAAAVRKDFACIDSLSVAAGSVTATAAEKPGGDLMVRIALVG